MVYSTGPLVRQHKREHMYLVIFRGVSCGGGGGGKARNLQHQIVFEQNKAQRAEIFSKILADTFSH